MKIDPKHILTATLILLPAAAYATDAYPPNDPTGTLPTWDRGDPNSVEAHWTFDIASGGLAPSPVDIEPTPGANGLVDGWAAYPAAPYTAAPFTPGIAYTTVNSDLEIRFPNIIDDLPDKYWQIQIHFGGTTVAPSLIDGIAFDPDASGGDVALGDSSPSEEFTSFGGSAPTVGPVPETIVGGFVTMYEGVIRPNPDFESFTFDLAPGTEIYQVHIDTLSIPEPSAYALLAGSLGLAAVALRRRLS